MCMKPPIKISIYYREGSNCKGEHAVVLNTPDHKLCAAVLNSDGSFKTWLGLNVLMMKLR